MKLITVVIPCHNEQDNILNIFSNITRVLKKINHKYNYEVIFVDDGSTDKTWNEIIGLSKNYKKNMRAIKFSKNFGKEMATTAGIEHAKGSAVIIIDADGQHPPELIPLFVEKWEQGSNTVVGIRKSNKGEGAIKKYGSKIFYNLFNQWSETKIIPGSTDYRLIDSNVRQSFIKLKEDDRITRTLIDWVGYDKSYIEFHANKRIAGDAAYSPRKLLSLAINGFISMSFTPLYFIGYLGIFIMTIATFLGVFSIVEQLLLGDPLGINITGSGFIGILLLFLVGLILVTQGISSIYIAKIFKESKKRPLYIVDESKSIGL